MTKHTHKTEEKYEPASVTAARMQTEIKKRENEQLPLRPVPKVGQFWYAKVPPEYYSSVVEILGYESDDRIVVRNSYDRAMLVKRDDLYVEKIAKEKTRGGLCGWLKKVWLG